VPLDQLQRGESVEHAALGLSAPRALVHRRKAATVPAV
jgi:hypothetical protein